jgi:RNA polymerase sigma-70 factor (ECF subfamily)
MSPDGSPDRSTGQALAEELVRVGKRDMAALRRLYLVTSGRLFGICLRITRNADTSEDVLQEVYIKVWNRAVGYDPARAHPMAWLSTIARNSAIDSYRAQYRLSKQDSADLPFADECVPSVDEELISEQEEARAHSLIAELEAQPQEHIRDIYLNGLTYAELADLHGVPVGTIKSRIHRALIVLNRRWESD